jgi:hypothetical protein
MTGLYVYTDRWGLSINFAWHGRLSMGMDHNRRGRFSRTVALAGPAPPAQGFIHFRTIDAVMLHNPNGLVRAEFVAHHAILLLVPRQTAGAIHPGRANGQDPFGFQRQTSNGTRRTDARANLAPFITVALAEIQAGR